MGGASGKWKGLKNDESNRFGVQSLCLTSQISLRYQQGVWIHTSLAGV